MKILKELKETETKTLRAVQDENGEFIQTILSNPNGEESMMFQTGYFKKGHSTVEVLEKIERGLK